MSNFYSNHAQNSIINNAVPQSQPIVGRETDMELNDAGGYAFTISKWKVLERFLILGSESGNCHTSATTLTNRNTTSLDACLIEDYKRTVDMIVDISRSGRPITNDACIYALAIAASNPPSAVYALDHLQQVCRIGTHLFTFLDIVQNFRGWGRTLRRSVGNWYVKRDKQSLMYQVTKYQSRNNWSNKDALRLSHPSPMSPEQNDIFRWVTHGTDPEKGVPMSKLSKDYLGHIWAFETIKATNDENVIISLIEDYDITLEMIPTALQTEKVLEKVWYNLGMTAMIRNLGRYSTRQMFNKYPALLQYTIDTLTDQEKLQSARIHPISVLIAYHTYKSGHGEKGSLSWIPNRKILDALDRAFYMTFSNVEPTNKRLMLSLDVSGSMGAPIKRGSTLTSFDAVAAMSLVTIAAENTKPIVNAFCDHLTNLDKFGSHMTLEEAKNYMDGRNFGSTDCSLPIMHALERKIPVDAFVIYTDNETWYGNIHPSEALKQYRKTMNINAKLIVVATQASRGSIADPADPYMLDVVGFDPSTPQIISEFIKL